MSEETPTPRTDVVEHEPRLAWAGASMRKRAGGGWGEADFARALERELAAANARVAELEKTIFQFRRALEQIELSCDKPSAVWEAANSALIRNGMAKDKGAPAQ